MAPEIEPSRPRYPDFLLIGAMKSGTTSLHEYLEEHPALFFPENKEPGFFSHEDRFSRGLGWYAALFADAKPDQLCGESSTCYSRWPHHGDVPRRIAATMPGVKFVYLMRHPVNRMYSHYRHRMAERFLVDPGPIPSFEQALEESSEYVDTSRYLFQIQRFLEHFPRDRFLFLFTETLEAHPEETTARVHEFLGVPPRPLVALSARNVFDDRFVQYSTRDQLTKLQKSFPSRVATRLLPASVKKKAREAFLSFAARRSRSRKTTFEAQLTRMDQATRERLLAEFAPANRELEDFLGFPVPERWRV